MRQPDVRQAEIYFSNHAFKRREPAGSNVHGGLLRYRTARAGQHGARPRCTMERMQDPTSNRLANRLTDSNPVTERASAVATAAPMRRAIAAADASAAPDYTPTPDRRYFVVRGRLWRLSNPALNSDEHGRLVQQLMIARRALREGANPSERLSARQNIDAAKRALGERGDPWWDDGSPDYNRQLAVNTPYASWFKTISARRRKN
jgi:hypothetical protein